MKLTCWAHFFFEAKVNVLMFLNGNHRKILIDCLLIKDRPALCMVALSWTKLPVKVQHIVSKIENYTSMTLYLMTYWWIDGSEIYRLYEMWNMKYGKCGSFDRS